MVCVSIKNKKLFFKADELKTAIHPDSESGLYCQQLNKQDSKSTVAENFFSLLKQKSIPMPFQILNPESPIESISY